MMSAIRKIIAGERGIAGVQQLLSADSIRAMVQSMLSPSYVLRTCQLRRAKLKPGRKLTAYYDAEVDAPTRSIDDRTVRPITVTWTLPGTPQKLATEEGALGAEIAQSELAAPFGQLIHIRADAHIHIQAAPFDPIYPQLARLSDPIYVRNLLADYAAKDSHWNVTPIRYRPRQRHVLRYDAPPRLDNDGRRSLHRPKTLFAKIYSGSSRGQFYAWNHQLADWMAASTTDVAVLRPLAYLPTDNTILYEQAAGQPISERLGGAARTVDQATAQSLRQTGAALRTLHTVPKRLTGGLPTRSIDEELKAITRTCEHIQTLLPETWQQIHTLLTHAAEAYAALPQESPTFIHGDFKADHVFVADNRLTLIDIDACAQADPAFDIGKFLADLAWWYAGAPPAALEHARQAFLAGYGLPATDPRLQRAHIWQALIGIKLIAHRVRIFETQWADRTDAGVQSCIAQYGMTGSDAKNTRQIECV